MGIVLRVITWLAVASVGAFAWLSYPVITPLSHFIDPVGMAEVVSKNDHDNILGHGSGVFISPTQFLTAKHVADDVANLKFKAEADDDPSHQSATSDTTYEARIRMASGETFKIVSVKYNDDYDLAIITVDHPYKGYIPSVSCKDQPTSSELINVGNPLDMEFSTIHFTVVGGNVNKKVSDSWIQQNKDSESKTLNGLVLVQGITMPGQSGSPVYDRKGDVVGTVLMTLTDTNNSNAYTGFGLYLSTHEVCDWIGGDSVNPTFLDQIKSIFGLS